MPPVPTRSLLTAALDSTNRASRFRYHGHKFQTFRWTYSPDHVPSIAFNNRHLENPNHILYQRLWSRVRERPRDDLWIFVQCPLSVSKFSVVRHLYKKRVKQAFKVALDERGFAETGRTKAGSKNEGNLMGTLRLLIKEDILTLEKGVLKQDMKAFVDELIRDSKSKTLRT